MLGRREETRGDTRRHEETPATEVLSIGAERREHAAATGVVPCSGRENPFMRLGCPASRQSASFTQIRTEPGEPALSSRVFLITSFAAVQRT